MMLSLFTALAQQVYFMLSFVSNSNAYPKQLTKDEELRYITAWENGDVNAKDKLIEHNLRLVAHIAKKYTCKGADEDDLISIGTIGLIKGVSTFSGAKSIKLSTYVSRCIENEILMAIRSSKKMRGELSIDEPIGIDKDGNNITFNDVLSKEYDEVFNDVEHKISCDNLHKFIGRHLDGKEKQIINMRYGFGYTKEYTQAEVAKVLGISRSYVSRLEKKAVEKLKAQYEDK